MKSAHLSNPAPKKVTITQVVAREVLDSRGYPTVEVDLSISSDGQSTTGRGMTPSGASTGEGEALELRDGDAKRFLGKGVLKAVDHVRTTLQTAVLGKSFSSQTEFDHALLGCDGTAFKTKLGANAILPVSMAFARAHAQIHGVWLYQSLAASTQQSTVRLPVPLMNILNGGKHADNGLAIQEFMIAPIGFTKFKEALRAGAEIFHHLKKILHDKNLSTAVGDEGGFAPQFTGPKPHTQALDCIMLAIEKAGYKPGSQIALALDCAASEFCLKNATSTTYDFEGSKLTAQDLGQIYQTWTEKYPLISIEDGLAEHDWKGWVELTERLGKCTQLIGDDLFVTNVTYLKKGLETKAANAILIKLNQIGSVSETLETMLLAKQSGFACITSHRSGETEDTFIADLAVGLNCGQIKTGSASRTDRVAKYNQLLRIEEHLLTLTGSAEYAGRQPFDSGKRR